MKPMLAATIKDFSTIRYPVLASPKLDGIRASVVSSVLLTRKLKLVPNHHVRNALSSSRFEGLDGELICGKSTAENAYRRTMSNVMSREGTPRVTFWVFDNWMLGGSPFWRRYENLPEFESADVKITIRRLPHVYLHNEQELLEYEQEQLIRGCEGVMLRDPDGLYKYGRSTLIEGGLAKLKRFEDSEAEILELVEEKRNDNESTINELGRAKRSSHKANKTPKGTTGALIVRDIKTGVEFKMGTGLDDATALAFWNDPPIGKIAKYKFQPTGVKNKPRFPVFLGLRAPEDM